MLHAPLRIAIAGLGTVGIGTASILQRHADLLAARAGRALKIVAASARDPDKPRDMSLTGIRFESDALALATAPDVDVVVEAIGGSDGIARDLVTKALENKKSVVTANKALIAHHGLALAAIAEKHGVVLAFEAAVTGGIPIIKTIREGLSGNRFTRIEGIFNGTSNYILSTMLAEKRPFDAVLKEAQEKGYAEADPTFDIDGIDAAHKLAILAALAFGTPPSIDLVYVEGIRHITLADMEHAAELGYRIKLLAIARLSKRGLEQRVHPCLVPIASPLAHVDDVYNAVSVEGDAVGRVFLEGAGAGAGPTGSSIVADLMDIARGVTYKPFSLPAKDLNVFPYADMAMLKSAYYTRLTVADKPGVLASVTAILERQGISVRSVVQQPHPTDENAQIILTTYPTTEASMSQALQAIETLESVVMPPHMIRMENA